MSSSMIGGFDCRCRNLLVGGPFRLPVAANVDSQVLSDADSFNGMRFSLGGPGWAGPSRTAAGAFVGRILGEQALGRDVSEQALGGLVRFLAVGCGAVGCGAVG